MTRIILPATITAALLWGAGCTVGPDYQRPAEPTPQGWVGPTTAPAGVPSTQVSVPSTQPLPAAQWWKNFGDPTLDKLVDQAIATNLDVKLAESRIRQARAQRGVASADLWPDLNVSGGYARTHQVNAGGNDSTGLYRAGFDASWELDVFGGTRRNIEAADADIAAAYEDRRDVLVTLMAEVAIDYLDLRSAQQRIAIAKETVDLQKHNGQLTRQRFNGGFVSGLDVATADAQMAATSSQIPPLEAFVRQSIYSIELLLGQSPGTLVNELSAEDAIPTAPPAVPLGLPSDLLRRRPDIRRAEAQLHAQTARVGVATANFYPTFSLTGSLGTQGGQVKDLGNWDSRFWSIGPSVSWPIFDAGRIRSNLAVQKAVTEQAALAYTQTILTALNDVESSLIAYAKEQQHRQALTDTVIAYRRALDLATKLYTNGQTDYLNVIAAQGSLYNAQDSLVQSDRAVAANLVALYKALGGGWEVTEQLPAK